ncbi:uracil-DNA glycosylase-like protein [Coemansia spiralis]|nr:uracil-DNA glycosylase-like protein [Coemansia spiralis]
MSQVKAESKKRKTLDAYFGPSKRSGARPTTAGPKSAKAQGKTPEPTAETGATAETPKEREPVVPKPSSEQELQKYRLEYETIDPSWLAHLHSELAKPYFVALKAFLQKESLSKEIYPEAKNVYSWSRFAPLDKVRVVILGQDPYHNTGQAHGLAFSVRPQIKTPPSLVNIYKALATDYPEFERPPHGYLRGWAEQGVLLLNASLTVEAHKPNSHQGKGWEQFTDRVIQLVNQNNANVVFMLWGSYAQKKGAHVDTRKHLVLKSVHPSPLSAAKGFFSAGHFRKANEYLERHNLAPIDWSHLPKEEIDHLSK